MHLAKAQGWQARLLDHRTSGDGSGDRLETTGDEAPAPPAPRADYSPGERRALLERARQSLRAAAAHLPRPNDPPPPEMAAKFAVHKGCFVTLTRPDGELRGCIGHIMPREALWDAVRDNARCAALEDTRFDPVGTGEVGQLLIEVSVLTEPRPLPFKSPEELLAGLRPHIDGVVLRVGGRSSTFLPQVWEQLPKKEEFLGQLAAKAGCPPRSWRQPGASVLVYQVESFTEPGPSGNR